MTVPAEAGVIMGERKAATSIRSRSEKESAACFKALIR